MWSSLAVLFVSVHVHVCARMIERSDLFLDCSPPHFWDRVSHWINWLHCVARKSRDPRPCHSSPGDHTWLLCGCWGSKLRTSCLSDRHLSTWAASQPLLVVLICFPLKVSDIRHMLCVPWVCVCGGLFWSFAIFNCSICFWTIFR